MPVTVLNANGLGQDSDVIAGVIWAADHGADVVVMAFSNPGFSQNLQDALDYAWSKNVVVVAATGNDAVSTPTFPAGDRGVMGVSGTDSNDNLATFSNYGPSVFISAPATDIQTTTTGDAYTVISGTSASAAIVAGAAAFMRAVDPTLSNGVIVGRLARMADPAGTQIQTGNGRINMARALADTGTDFIQPAGAPPVGGGGPCVGPYVAAAICQNLAFFAGPVTVTAGQISAVITVQAQRSNGTSCDPTSVTVTLTSSSAGGTFFNSAGTTQLSPAQVTTDPANSNKASFTYKDTVAGSPTITASSNLNNAPQTETVNPAAANKLSFNQQPTNTVAGVSISPAVTVRIEDQFGNLTSSTANVSIAIQNNPGGGSLSGTATVAASGGVATFSTLSINKTGTGYTLQATSTGLIAVTSSADNITAGAVNALTFGQQPTDTVAGQSIAPAVTVQAQDSFGNNVPNASVAIALATGSTGTLSGTTTRSTNTSGVATFDNLSINLVGSKQLRATSGTPFVTSTAFNITPAAANKLVFVQQPTNTAAGMSIAHTVPVQAKYACNNNVPGAPVAMTLTTGTGTLSGTTTQSTNGSGLATFNDLSINLTGSKNLTASSAGLTSASSSAFSITAAAVNTLTFVQQPANTVAGVSISPAVTVQAKDAFGNNVPSAPVAMTLTTGTTAPLGTTTRRTREGGRAPCAHQNINRKGAKNRRA